MGSFRRYLTFFSLILLLPKTAGASGFTIYDFGVEEQSQGNAVAAQVETPAAIFYNPAGIAGLSGTQVEGGVSALFPKVTFHSDVSDQDTKVHSGVLLPTYLYATKNFDKINLGFGFFSANGNKAEYPKSWEGRFFLTSAELLEFNFAPTIGYQLLPNVSIGASAVLTQIYIKRSNQISLFPFFTQEGSLDIKADGLGIGSAIGLKAHMGSSIVGIVYKGPMKIKYDGSATFQVPSAASSFFPNGDIHTTQHFPQMVVVGLANQAIPRFTLEADLQWTNWNSFNSQTLTFDKKTSVVNDTTLPYNWKDTWTLRVGGHYDINDALVVRLGYVFDPTAVPGSTISPELPESDKHILEGGFGMHKDRWAFDFFYGIILSKSRQANNSLPGMPIHQGKYTSSANGGGVSLRYQF